MPTRFVPVAGRGARRAALAATLAAVLPLLACGPCDAPREVREWPAGTVLALDSQPILAEEVERAGDAIALIDPGSSPDHVRRLALTNVVFQRCAGRLLAGAERDRALERALERRAQLSAGTLPEGAAVDPALERLEGGFDRLGLELWLWAHDAPLGEWSPPIETTGGWQVARTVRREAALQPRDSQLAVDLFLFSYLNLETMRPDIEARLDRARLEYVDPRWRDLVPTLWQHRLRGGSP